MPPPMGPRLDQIMLSAQTKNRREQLLADSKRALGEPMTSGRLVQQSGHRVITVEQALLMCCSTEFLDRRISRSPSGSAPAD